ncbi:hypothetical protein [Floridanema aerugineum]|uniref:Uncharacterized protein n=1 Tax=Floridaenema aerugineum BLCC-F46 TaxID=3153654 RepID=A0ABV4X3K6_9CYAN
MVLQAVNKRKATDVMKSWRLVANIDYQNLDRDTLKNKLRDIRERVETKVNLSASTEHLKLQWKRIVDDIEYMASRVEWHKVFYSNFHDSYLYYKSILSEEDKANNINSPRFPALDQLEEIGQYFYLRQLTSYVEEKNLQHSILVNIMDVATLREHLTFFINKGVTVHPKLNQSPSTLQIELLKIVSDLTAATAEK